MSNKNRRAHLTHLGFSNRNQAGHGTISFRKRSTWYDWIVNEKFFGEAKVGTIYGVRPTPPFAIIVKVASRSADSLLLQECDPKQHCIEENCEADGQRKKNCSTNLKSLK